MTSDNHPGESPVASNVVALTDAIVKEGESSATELERKRHIVVRAHQITISQLQSDAQKMMESAIVSEHPLEKRLQIMDQARALFMTIGWLQGLVGAESPKSEVQSPTSGEAT